MDEDVHKRGYTYSFCHPLFYIGESYKKYNQTFDYMKL